MGHFEQVQQVRRVRRVIVGAWILSFAGVLAAGCEPNAPPTSPTPAAMNLAGTWSGTWSGTWTFSVGGAMVTDSVTMTLAQTGASVNGTWTAGGGSTGTVGFTAATTVNGSLSINHTLLTGQLCAASTTISGTASSSALQFTLGTLSNSGLCQWATGQAFSVTR
jgi:hypothetical protein